MCARVYRNVYVTTRRRGQRRDRDFRIFDRINGPAEVVVRPRGPLKNGPRGTVGAA